jgi:holin-like protein
MLPQLVLLMGFQLLGDAVIRLTGLPFPGPLCGMALLLLYLQLSGGASAELSAVGTTLVDNLGLLFVPAGAAIVTYVALLTSEGVAILGALIISTMAAVLAGGLVARGTIRPPVAAAPR